MLILSIVGASLSIKCEDVDEDERRASVYEQLCKCRDYFLTKIELYLKHIMSLSEVVSIGSGKLGLMRRSQPLEPFTCSSVPIILEVKIRVLIRFLMNVLLSITQIFTPA